MASQSFLAIMELAWLLAVFKVWPLCYAKGTFRLLSWRSQVHVFGDFKCNRPGLTRTLSDGLGRPELRDEDSQAR